MLLKKIELENIRSHMHSSISFHEGKTLLAGNIGSGKSSILLAVDFALFGIARGILSGSALLRNGKDSGRVRLYFEIDGKEIIIERKLKKTSLGITQDSGSIIIDGNKQDKSANELKQAILDLLNYPQELLTKSKGLIYRYTVYTPQEEMKQILLSESELRLDILRRVFGIDKYKRMKENSSIFLKSLRDKKKLFSSLIADLDEKKNELSSKEYEKSSLDKELKTLHPQHQLIKNKIQNVKVELTNLEEKKDRRNNCIKNLEVRQSDLIHEAFLIEKNEKELSRLKEELLVLENEIKDFAVEDTSRENLINTGGLENEIKNNEQAIRNLLNKLSELNASKSHAKKVIDNLEQLDFCPICNQVVGKEHKHAIIAKEDAEIASLNNYAKEIESELLSMEKLIEDKKTKLKQSQLRERQQELFKIKTAYQEQKKSSIARLEHDNKALLASVENITSDIQDLKNKIASIGITDYERLKESLDNFLGEERTIIIKLGSLEHDMLHLSQLSENLHKEIQKKESIKKNLEYLSSLYSWIDEFFINTLEVMEKRIMLKLHRDFNSLFEKWFDILVGNENLKISIGEDFSPKILQDGYDLEYENLSGGEKTAAALAYRLALNQVINNLISNIKTRDLLILDEPTDGFSDEQLDRMKNVLDELKIRQILIVSHEDKIESFVDNIIRFQKEGHVTRVG